MQIAFGALYIAPDTFWNMTWAEFRSAYKGWKRFGPPAWLGSSEDADPGKKPPRKSKISKAEAERMKDFIREMEKKHPPGKVQDPKILAFLKARKAQRGRPRNRRL